MTLSERLQSTPSAGSNSTAMSANIDRRGSAAAEVVKPSSGGGSGGGGGGGEMDSLQLNVALQRELIKYIRLGLTFAIAGADDAPGDGSQWCDVVINEERFATVGVAPRGSQERVPSADGGGAVKHLVHRVGNVASGTIIIIIAVLSRMRRSL